MNCHCEICQGCAAHGCLSQTMTLFMGMELSFLTLRGEEGSSCLCPSGEGLFFVFGRRGRLLWERKDGARLELGPDDYVLCAPSGWQEATASLPSGLFEGLALRVEQTAFVHPPADFVQESGVMDGLRGLSQKALWQAQAGGEALRRLVEGFYSPPGAEGTPLALACRRVKALEMLLYWARPGEEAAPPVLTAQNEQIHEIHEYLTQHIDRRVTIDELSRRYLMNPTTLKAAFKTVYGSSLAAHIKEHRMELAARLLRESDLSMAEIAQRVGYESQSRLTAAFKDYFGVLPTEYRQQHTPLR